MGLRTSLLLFTQASQSKTVVANPSRIISLILTQSLILHHFLWVWKEELKSAVSWSWVSHNATLTIFHSVRICKVHRSIQFRSWWGKSINQGWKVPVVWSVSSKLWSFAHSWKFLKCPDQITPLHPRVEISHCFWPCVCTVLPCIKNYLIHVHGRIREGGQSHAIMYIWTRESLPLWPLWTICFWRHEILKWHSYHLHNNRNKRPRSNNFHHITLQTRKYLPVADFWTVTPKEVYGGNALRAFPLFRNWHAKRKSPNANLQMYHQGTLPKSLLTSTPISEPKNKFRALLL